jgi:hypothetical protein
MNNLELNKETIKTKIREAFASIPHPREKMISSESLSSELEIKCFLSKKWTRWEDIPGKIIDYKYDSLPAFSGEGLQFVLPAYMIYALDDTQSNVGDFVIYNLTAPTRLNNPDRRERFTSRFSQFTDKQKEAIVLFLKYQEREKQSYPNNDATEALQSYWEIGTRSSPGG